MMPMSSPGWFDDFPEYLTEADYRDIGEVREFHLDAAQARTGCMPSMPRSWSWRRRSG